MEIETAQNGAIAWPSISQSQVVSPVATKANNLTTAKSLTAHKEWPGDMPSKFLPTKKIGQAPSPVDSAYHPIFNAKQRTHFPEPRSSDFQWKSSRKEAPRPVDKDTNPVPEGKKFYKDMNFTDSTHHPERKHLPERNARTTKTLDNPKLCLKAFATDNRQSEVEHEVEKNMTRKGRITNLAAQRAGMQMTSLGDKNYKAAEYETGFFFAGGLVAGSTQ